MGNKAVIVRHVNRGTTADKTVSWVSGATASESVELSDYAMGGMHVGSGFSGLTVSYNVSYVKSGNYTPLYDGSTQVTTGIPSGGNVSQFLPPPVMAFQHVKFILSSAAATGTAMYVSLKG